MEFACPALFIPFGVWQSMLISCVYNLFFNGYRFAGPPEQSIRSGVPDQRSAEAGIAKDLSEVIVACLPTLFPAGYASFHAGRLGDESEAANLFFNKQHIKRNAGQQDNKAPGDAFLSSANHCPHAIAKGQQAKYHIPCELAGW